MATIVQQLTWELKKEDLEALLQEAGPGYAALQFKICIDAAGQTKFLVSMVDGKAKQAEAQTSKESAFSSQKVLEKEACPVPPGCN
jgi:hypothetical protein